MTKGQFWMIGVALALALGIEFALAYHAGRMDGLESAHASIKDAEAAVDAARESLRNATLLDCPTMMVWQDGDWIWMEFKK